jgi:DeoR family transcriptional regulator of aga operon
MNPQALSKGELRREKLLNLLKTQGRVTLQEIIDGFDCSEATARRDLDLLEKSGLIIRTIGGALFEGGGPSHREVSFQEKKQHLWLEKEAIAAKAASLVNIGDIVGLTGGTTTYLIAKALKNMPGITVVTNAVNIAADLADADGVQIVVTGGVMRNKSFELCGPLAEKTLQDINISKMFIGIDGISAEQGLTTYSELEAQIAKLLIKRSSQSIAVFDHTKADRASLFHIAPLSSIHACVTDAELEGSLPKELIKSNVTLHKAEIRV